MKLYLTIFWIQYLASLTSFIFSLVFNRHLKKISYLKNFFIYNTVGILGISSHVVDRFILYERFRDELYIYLKISLLFHFFFLGFKIVQFLTIEKIKKVAFRTYLFLGILVVSFTLMNIFDRKGIYSFAIGDFGLLILSTLYYYEVFHLSPENKLQEIPSFWIVTGIFLSMSLSIPCVLFEYYIKKNLAEENYPILIAIGCFSIVILHLFFIKGFYCAKNLNKQ